MWHFFCIDLRSVGLLAWVLWMLYHPQIESQGIYVEHVSFVIPKPNEVYTLWHVLMPAGQNMH